MTYSKAAKKIDDKFIAGLITRDEANALTQRAHSIANDFVINGNCASIKQRARLINILVGHF